MNLSHAYSEDVLGFVVTDIDTGRSINAQFQEYQHGYGEYAVRIDVACDGDESHEGWSHEEQADVVEYLREQSDVRQVVSAASEVMGHHGYYGLAELSDSSYAGIIEAAKAIGWEPDDE